MTTRHRYTILVLIVANFLVLGYLASHDSTFNDSHESIPTTLTLLPNITIQDDKGQSMVTNDFIGSPLFVQFVNSNVNAQVASIDRILENPTKRIIPILLITRLLCFELSNGVIILLGTR